MADFSHQDMLGFMEDDERQYYESPERTQEERDKIRAEQEELWNLIPTPTEDQLKPPYMHVNDWSAHQQGSKDVLPYNIRKWKRQRKAEARKRLAEAKRQSSKPKTKTLGGTDEMWWGHFYVSHLSQEERNRIKRGEFQPEEIEKLAKGESPWAWHKPLPAGLQPPADAPPFDEWIKAVTEQFTPRAEKIRQAAADAARQSGLLSESPAPTVKPEDEELRGWMPKESWQQLNDPTISPRIKKQIRARAKGARWQSNLPLRPSKKKEEEDVERDKLKARLKELGVAVDKPKPYTQPKHVSKEEVARLMRGENPSLQPTRAEIRQPALWEVLIYCWDTPHLYYIAGGFLVGGGIALALSFWLWAEVLFAIGIALFVAKGIHALWGKENRWAIATIFSIVGLMAIAFEVGLIEWKRHYDRPQQAGAVRPNGITEQPANNATPENSEAQSNTKREHRLLQKTVRQLLSLYEGRTALEADKLMEPFKNEWIRVTGKVSQVSPGPFPDTILVYLDVAEKEHVDNVGASFDVAGNPEKEKRLRQLGIGDQITLDGKIYRSQERSLLYLVECEHIQP